MDDSTDEDNDDGDGGTSTDEDGTGGTSTDDVGGDEDEFEVDDGSCGDELEDDKDELDDPDAKDDEEEELDVGLSAGGIGIRLNAVSIGTNAGDDGGSWLGDEVGVLLGNLGAWGELLGECVGAGGGIGTGYGIGAGGGIGIYGVIGAGGGICIDVWVDDETGIIVGI